MAVQRADLALGGGTVGRATLPLRGIGGQLDDMMRNRTRRGRVAAHIIDQYARIDPARGITGGAVLEQGTLQGHEQRAAIGRQRHAFHPLIVAAARVGRLQ